MKSRLPTATLQALWYTLLAGPLAAQHLPTECIKALDVVPVVRAGERIEASDQAMLDSILQEGAWIPDSNRVPQALLDLWRADSVGVLAGLASAAVDVSRHGTAVAAGAAEYYRQLGGAPQPMLLLLQMSFTVSRRPMGLRAIVSLHTDEERRIVLSFACDAAWQPTAFLADTSYSSRWADKRFDYWPDQALLTIKEAGRLLGGLPPALKGIVKAVQRYGYGSGAG